MERISKKKIAKVVDMLFPELVVNKRTQAMLEEVADAQLAADKKDCDKAVEQARIEERGWTISTLMDLRRCPHDYCPAEVNCRECWEEVLKEGRGGLQ